MKRDASFWNRHAAGYARRPIADEAAYQKKLEISRGYFTPEHELLELGCGTGSTALLHAPYVKHIRAIDIADKMLAIAKEKQAAQNISNISFECAQCDMIRSPENHYDAVLALSLLHLLRDKDAVIANAFTMLKPGGAFITSTVCLGDWLRLFKYIGPVGRWLGLLPVLNVFRASELVEAMQKAGFVIDHQWQPAKNKALFLVAKKPAGANNH